MKRRLVGSAVRVKTRADQRGVTTRDHNKKHNFEFYSFLPGHLYGGAPKVRKKKRLDGSAVRGHAREFFFTQVGAYHKCMSIGTFNNTVLRLTSPPVYSV